MANLINLTCAKCTPSTNGGFILKLQNKDIVTIQTAFGQKTQGKQQTYYMKVDNECKVGFAADLDLDQFRVVERPYDLQTDTTGIAGEEGFVPATSETILLKWLVI